MEQITQLHAVHVISGISIPCRHRVMKALCAVRFIHAKEVYDIGNIS
jgi:hypothetical protein